MNLNNLKDHVMDVSKPTALCDLARAKAFKGENVVKLLHFEKQHGFYYIMIIQCCGCGKFFKLENSDELKNTKKNRGYKSQMVWETVVTGGGLRLKQGIFGMKYYRKN